jgi:hypothetical protein
MIEVIALAPPKRRRGAWVHEGGSMSSDPEVNDSLLRTIAELRTEVNHLIDEQVAYVKERVEEPVSPRVLRAAPVTSVAESDKDIVKVRSLDPRQRLDALAKHLDHRLRLANVPVPERNEEAPATQE